jgi:hypothetical protein
MVRSVTKKPAVKKPRSKPADKPAAKQTKSSKNKSAKSAKDLATERGEPYVAVISMDIDPKDVQNGSFELDWNAKFIANLIRAGYQMDSKDTDADIVDRWFTAVCRNVVLETYEQYEAMNPQRLIKSRDLGDGRSEIS